MFLEVNSLEGCVNFQDHYVYSTKFNDHHEILKLPTFDWNFSLATSTWHCLGPKTQYHAKLRIRDQRMVIQIFQDYHLQISLIQLVWDSWMIQNSHDAILLLQSRTLWCHLYFIFQSHTLFLDLKVFQQMNQLSSSQTLSK